MEYTFRAKKMIDRVNREGRSELLDADTLAIINSMDGMKGSDYNWRAMVNGDDLVYIPEAERYVARCDCD